MSVLQGLFYIGVFIIGVTIAIDAMYLLHHKIHGTPLAAKLYQEVKETKDETIAAQKLTIKELQETIRAQRIRIRKLYAQLNEGEEDE